MDRFLRMATPLILLALALLVWFETFLRNENASAWLGETGVLRFAVGILCLYVLMGWVEQQRTATAFKEVLSAFKRFHEGRGQAREEPQRDAVSLLIGALSAGDRKVRANAVEHLKRLTGQDYGDDKGRWEEWLAEAFGPGDPP
ncbi:MAG: hypothetical protein O7F11_00920 [Acidobacteria bacterium]|nr:hypothetical protein [Acidobacteriota bacterium]